MLSITVTVRTARIIIFSTLPDAGSQGGGGGERANFMYSYHNFSLVNRKRMLEVFVHTNFSIRVFWDRRDR